MCMGEANRTIREPYASDSGVWINRPGKTAYADVIGRNR